MEDKRFTYTKIVHFNNCSDCPHNCFHGEDYECNHDECELLNQYIHCYLIDGDKDFRNSDGILDDCPYLKDNSKIEED